MSEPSEWAAPTAKNAPTDPLPPAPPTGGIPADPQNRPKPGIVALRPLGVQEILDGAIAYIRGNPLATLGISAVVITITQLVQLPISAYLLGPMQAVLQDPTPSPDAALAAIGATLAGTALSAFVTFIATTILTGLLIVVLGQAVLGRRTSLGAAWAGARGRVPGLLGLSLLTTLALLLVMVVAFVPGILLIASGTSGGGAAIVIGAVIGFCAAVFLGVSWSMATPAYVLEGITVMGAYRRSFGLVRPQWWRIFGVLLLGGVITAIVAFVLSLPFSLVSGLFGAPVDTVTGAVTTAGVLASVVTAIGTIVAGTVTAPLSAGINGLLYIDQRMRREAFDLELLRAAGVPDAPLPGPPSADPPAGAQG
jgi:hypothetical protein